MKVLLGVKYPPPPPGKQHIPSQDTLESTTLLFPFGRMDSFAGGVTDLILTSKLDIAVGFPFFIFHGFWVSLTSLERAVHRPHANPQRYLSHWPFFHKIEGLFGVFFWKRLDPWIQHNTINQLLFFRLNIFSPIKEKTMSVVKPLLANPTGHHRTQAVDRSTSSLGREKNRSTINEVMVRSRKQTGIVTAHTAGLLNRGIKIGRSFPWNEKIP